MSNKLVSIYKNNKKNNEYIITTVGRVIFNSYLPEHWDFINENITKNNLKNIILKYSREMDNQSTVEFLDNIKDLGFNYSYVSGLSFKVSDIFVPENKQQIINKAILYQIKGDIIKYLTHGLEHLLNCLIN